MTVTYTSAYLDVPVYLRAATNQETVSLLGLNATLVGAASLAAGAVSLTVSSSAGWVAGPLWLLDGPWSEVAQVTGSVDATHLTLAAPGTRWPYAPGISLSQAGATGSLAEVILRASAWIEGYCQQGTATDRSLYALSRTEQWDMPGARAWLDRDVVASCVLVAFRCRVSARSPSIRAPTESSRWMSRRRGCHLAGGSSRFHSWLAAIPYWRSHGPVARGSV